MENILEETEESKEKRTLSLWETLTTKLSDLESNINNFIEPVAQFQPINEINELASEISKLQKNLMYTLDPFWQQIKDEMFDLKYYIKERDEEIKKLQIACQSQKKELQNTQNELRTIKTMLYHQSSFTATLGSTLCSLLWKASKEPQIVENIITGNKITDFFGTVTESMKSFFDAFEDDLPEPQSDEMQFIVSLLGVVANIAAVPRGRQFMSNSDKGIEVILQMIEVAPKVPASGICIQKIVLMALFNVSIDTHGISFIESDRPLLKLLVKNISHDNNELMFISIKLLQSITYEIKTEEVLALLRTELPVIKLQELRQNCTNELRPMIAEIERKLNSAALQNEEENHHATYNGFQ